MKKEWLALEMSVAEATRETDSETIIFEIRVLKKCLRRCKRASQGKKHQTKELSLTAYRQSETDRVQAVRYDVALKHGS